NAGVIILRDHVSAEREHSRSQNARQRAPTPIPQPQVAQQERQPRVQKHPNFERLEQDMSGGQTGNQEKPRGRIEQRDVDIDCEVIGIRRGWEGLTHVDLRDPASRTRYVLPLNRENTRTIDRTGGTYLHSSRTNPSKMKKLPPALEGQEFPKYEFTKRGETTTVYDVSKAVLKNLETLSLDYLIAIGGDDTLSYAAALDRQGMKVIAVPKTMDND